MVKLKASQDELGMQHPDWMPNNDARVSWLDGAFKILTTTRVELLFYRDYLAYRNWWDGVPKREGISGDREVVENFLNEYDIHIRFWTFLSVFIQVEESLRQVIKHLNPNAYNKYQSSFAELCRFLLAETGLGKYQRLFDLLRHTRNIIHTNGVFSPVNGKDLDIEWEGQRFQFLAGKRIRWFTHDILRQFILWLNGAMFNIMISQPVSQMPVVKRFEEE